MHIASLKTTNFRNLNGVELQFVPEVNVFHGLNGSGKTNLLEALHVCCLGKSQRGAQDQTMVRSQTDVYRLECALQEDDRRKEVARLSEADARRSRLTASHRACVISTSSFKSSQSVRKTARS